MNKNEFIKSKIQKAKENTDESSMETFMYLLGDILWDIKQTNELLIDINYNLGTIKNILLSKH